MIAAAGALLASAALAAFVVWEVWLWSLIAAVIALTASAWAILVAPSRALLALSVGSIVIASITLILWWDAVRALVESS